MVLNNKNIVLCITGGIAAYKAVSLASLLKKAGSNVYPVLTKNACEFITPLTLKTITKNKVTTDMFDNSDFIPHISLSELADILIVAPATANIIAKAANGIADDITSSFILSSTAVKIIVPAMNSNMYLNPITQDNIERLKKYGFIFMDPGNGELACGTSGQGRFPEPEEIINFINDLNKQADSNINRFFNNKKILITAGGTIEDIDPVRYLSNRSSGRMGLAFAEEFIKRGGDVTIIIGNVDHYIFNKFRSNYNVKIIPVRSAEQMKNAVKTFENDYDIYFMAAAVADYTIDYSENKIKKNDSELTLTLKRTDDILKGLKKRNDAVYIGFAAESENIIENGRNKLIKKELDFIIVNNIKGNKAAIGGENAEVYLLNKWDKLQDKIEYCNKKNIAIKVMDKLSDLLIQKII